MKKQIVAMAVGTALALATIIGACGSPPGDKAATTVSGVQSDKAATTVSGVASDGDHPGQGEEHGLGRIHQAVNKLQPILPRCSTATA